MGKKKGTGGGLPPSYSQAMAMKQKRDAPPSYNEVMGKKKQHQGSAGKKGKKGEKGGDDIGKLYGKIAPFIPKEHRGTAKSVADGVRYLYKNRDMIKKFFS